MQDKYIQTDRDKVYGIILTMDGELDISKKVSPENREKFIHYVKEFIDLDMSNEFYLEFNTNYSTLKKKRK